MNIIPSTFNEQQIDRTVIGGDISKIKPKMDISVIMLNTIGSHLRVKTIENLISCNFKSIIWVEPSSESFNLDDVSKRFPQVKYVVPKESCSTGELINVCVSEIDSEYFLVLNDSLKIPNGILLENLAEHLIKDKTYCIVPRLIDQNGESVFVNIVPEAKKNRFLMTQTEFVSDGIKTLYPVDFIGLYNRKKFIELGGYDYQIKSSYWQNADLSLRAWLWGHKIKVSASFLINYENPRQIQDFTRDYSYLQFFVKNILPVYKEDHGVIKNSSFMNFKMNSKCGFFEALSYFKSAKKWVELNKFRFKMDVNSLIENWGSVE